MHVQAVREGVPGDVSTQLLALGFFYYASGIFVGLLIGYVSWKR